MSDKAARTAVGEATHNHHLEILDTLITPAGRDLVLSRKAAIGGQANWQTP